MKQQLLAITFTGLIGAALIGAGTAYAQPPFGMGAGGSHFDDRGSCPHKMMRGKMGHGSGDHGSGAFMKQMQQELQLTDAQIKEMDTFREQQSKQCEARREEMSELRRAIHDLDPADKDYQKNLEKLAAREGELTSRKILDQGQMRSKFHSILTDEQRQKLEQKREEMREQRLQRIKEKREALDKMEQELKAE